MSVAWTRWLVNLFLRTIFWDKLCPLLPSVYISRPCKSRCTLVYQTFPSSTHSVFTSQKHETRINSFTGRQLNLWFWYHWHCSPYITYILLGSGKMKNYAWLQIDIYFGLLWNLNWKKHNSIKQSCSTWIFVDDTYILDVGE